MVVPPRVLHDAETSDWQLPARPPIQQLETPAGPLVRLGRSAYVVTYKSTLRGMM